MCVVCINLVYLHVVCVWHVMCCMCGVYLYCGYAYSVCCLCVWYVCSVYVCDVSVCM